GWACLGWTGISGTLLPWFSRERRRAMTLALTSPSLGGIVLVPLLVQLTQRLGFGAAVALVGLLMAGTLLPLAAFVIRRRPEDLGLGPDGDPRSEGVVAVETPGGGGERRGSRRAALGTARFWTVTLPFGLALMAQVGVLVHQFTLLRPALGETPASLTVSATAFAALVGRLAIGPCADRMDVR